MKKNVSKLLVLAMFFSLVQPIYFSTKVHGQSDETIIASSDKFVDSTGVYPEGLDVEPYGVNLHLVGYERVDGEDYGASEAAIKFQLDSIERNKVIESAELMIYVALRQDTGGTAYVDLWGSNDDSWEEDTTDIPSKDQNIVLNDTDITQGEWKSFDVTQFIQSQVSGDGVASFVMLGFSNPITESVQVQFGFYDRIQADFAPRLEITYVPNQPPTNMSLSANTIEENALTGTTIGEFTTDDPDDNETFSYSIISGDTSSFDISGNTLITNEAFDYETKDSYTITVSVEDSVNHTFDKDFTIQVIDVNESPSGSILINNDESQVNSTDVNLNLTSSDPENDSLQMRFSNDNSIWSELESAASNKLWTLGSGDGTKTVYMELHDGAGNMSITSISDSIELDTTPPGVTGVSDGQLSKTDLTISFDEGTGVLNGNPFNSGDTVSAEGNYTLVITDVAGNVTTVHFTIDKTAPTGTLSINNGAGETTSQDVTLDVTGDDGNGAGNIEMRFSHDGSTWNDDWEVVKSTSIWNLPPGYGSKSVYMELKDEAGNSSTVMATITLKSIPVSEDSEAKGIEDETLQFTTSDFGYSNADGSAMEKIMILSLPEHGELQVDGMAVVLNQEIVAVDVAKLTFIPEENWHGTVGFSWKASDGSNYSTNNALVTIELASVNDLPVVSDIRLNTTGGKPVTGQFEATDVDGNLLMYSIVDQPDKGKLTIIDANVGEFSFRPKSGNYGEITFTYKASDGAGDSNIATVTVENKRPYSPPVRPINGGPNNGEIEVSIDGLMNGKAILLEISEQNGKKVLTMSFDENALNDLFNGEEKAQRISIHVKQPFDVIKGEYSNKIVEMLKQNSTIVEINTENASYTLPTSQIDMDDIQSQLGDKPNSDDISLLMEIAQTSEDVIQKFEQIAKQKNYTITVPAETFNMSFSYGDYTNEISHFSKYVETIVKVPEGTGKMTTAVLLLPSGTLLHVPTKIVEEDGQSIAVISSMLNSNIAFVQHNVPFEDMNQHWAESAVQELASRLIVNGVDQNHYAPNKEITRAEFITILTRGLGMWTSNAKTGFTDVSETDWYNGALNTATEYDLISGYSDQTFRPDQQIKRQEVMVMVSRAAKLMGMETELTEEEIDELLGSFTDKDQISPWARESVALSIKLGIVLGNNNTITPEEPMTRAEMAVVILRMLKGADLI